MPTDIPPLWSYESPPSFSGDHPTHIVIAGPNATAEQVAYTRSQLEDGFPAILPDGWAIEPLTPLGYITPPSTPMLVNESPTFGLLFVGFIGGIISTVVALVLGGVIR